MKVTLPRCTARAPRIFKLPSLPCSNRVFAPLSPFVCRLRDPTGEIVSARSGPDNPVFDIMIGGKQASRLRVIGCLPLRNRDTGALSSRSSSPVLAIDSTKVVESQPPKFVEKWIVRAEGLIENPAVDFEPRATSAGSSSALGSRQTVTRIVLLRLTIARPHWRPTTRNRSYD